MRGFRRNVFRLDPAYGVCALVAALVAIALPTGAAGAPAVFTVNSTGDGADVAVGNGICSTGGTVGSAPECTLRAAFQESNANVGTDTIAFNLPTAPFSIQPATQLPTLTDPVVIDGTTQPSWVDVPIVEVRRPAAEVGIGPVGLRIAGGDSTVRGLVINSFHNEIVLDGEGGNVIAGNFIGTDVTGTQDGGGAGHNDQQILVFEGEENVIGGTSVSDRNVVAGKGPTHISLRTANNVVRGNFIGTNAAGDAAVAGSAGAFGVQVDGTAASGNVIGGDVPGAGNLISGNPLGIAILGGAGTVVQGNRIGTDVDGTAAVPNATGIDNQAEDTLIGGLDADARNIVSGNELGIISQGDDVVVQGNFIGPDASGTATPSNLPLADATGLVVCGADGLVGGTDAGARNVISGNSGNGITLCNFEASRNRIEGNFIGVDVNGDPLGNAGSGITCCLIGSIENVIGGTAASAGNVIAYNGGFGVRVSNTNGPEQNAAAILGNSIHSNGFLGIDLGHPAPGNFATENDLLDADDGPNGVQNFPVLDWTSTGSPTMVTGTLRSKPNETYRVEFFHNDVCDTFENGFLSDNHLGRFGEGETFMGAIDVTTNAAGDASFSQSYPISTDVTDVITATATAEDGSTSEFSECRADLEIEKSDEPDPVEEGETLTYTIDVTNQGPAPALEVVVQDQLPGAGDFSLGSIVPSQGSCALVAGKYRCELGGVVRYGTATITITGTVTASAPASLTNTASADSELRDPDPTDNTASATTEVVEDRPTGTIVVRKATLPSGSTEGFSFTASYDTDGFTLKDGESDTSGQLAPGSYSVSETAAAGWITSSSCDDGSPASNIALAADETVTCTFTNTRRGTVTLRKTTNGVVDPTKDLTFVLTGPGLPSGGVSRSTFGDQDGVLSFGAANLAPSQTYRMCESPVPAGFTSLWRLDGLVVTPYNPDASKSPPEDLGTRCYDFSVAPGQTRAFDVDNSRPGGDTRTIGYWKNWNRCTGGNQAATAAKNGGAAAGFFLVEDLLPQLVGDFSVTTCQKAVKLLSKQDQAGKNKASDAAYELGAQLLAARFNLAAGAETCAAIQQAVLAGQTLLDAVNFTGSGDYLGSKSKDPKRQQATALASTIDRYNNGAVC